MRRIVSSSSASSRYHQRVADDDRQRIVELVRHAGEQFAERRHLLVLEQHLALVLELFLHRQLLGEVDRRRYRDLLALVVGEPAVGGGGKFLALRVDQVELVFIDVAVGEQVGDVVRAVSG